MGKRTEKPAQSRKDPAAIKAARPEAGERQLARAAIGGKPQKESGRPAAPATMEASYNSDSSLEESIDDEEEEDEDNGSLGEVDVGYGSDEEDDEEEDSFDFDQLSPEQQKALLASMEEMEEDEEEEEEDEGASEDDLAGMGVGSGDDDSDMEDDDEEQKEININWDAREMFTRHVDAISGLIDSAIPDGENLVDRHDFGTCLRRSIATTLVTVTELEEDDAASEASVGTEVVVEGENTYGVCAFVPVSGFAKRFESCAGLLKLLGRAPEHTLESGTPALRLLQSNSDAAPARALLFVNDHLNIVPPTVIAQVHTVMLEDLDTVLAAKKHDGVPVGPASHVVMLARVQRSKSESGASRPGEFDLAAHDFCRWEDEVYFRRRDKRIATVVHRFPRYVEGQEDQDIPRCVVFAIELSAFRAAVAKLTPLAAAVMSR